MASVPLGAAWEVRGGDQRRKLRGHLSSLFISENTRRTKGTVLSRPSLCLAFLYEDFFLN